MPRKVLIINPFGVGDVLFSTPLLSLIKNSGSYIGYICNNRTLEILETNPDIDEVFVFERDEYRGLWKKSRFECIRRFLDFWRKIKRHNFNMAIDLSLGKEYAFLCWLIGIKERRGFDYKGRGRFLTHRIKFEGFDDKPVAEYYLELLEETTDHRPKTTGLNTILITTPKDNFYIDNFLKSKGIEESDFLVGIAPGGGVSFGLKEQDRRRWGAKKFSELADKIVETFGAKIILIWGPGEEGLVKDIATLMKQKAFIAPQTTIRQMAALCKRCRIVICSEGGPLHIAASQAVKTISLFGPVDEKVYGPYPPGKNNVVITVDTDCRPCYRRFKLSECNTKKCLEDISVETVFNSIIDICGEGL